MKPKPTDEGSAVWTLADFFRAASPPGWRAKSIEFERQGPVGRAAGFRWDLSFQVRAGAFRGEEFEITVLVSQEDDRGNRGLSARRRLALYEFLEALECRMWRFHFGGSFSIDRHDGQCFGHFNKYVETAEAVRREIDALASLRLGAR